MIIPIGYGQITHEIRTTGAPYPANVVYGVHQDGVTDMQALCEDIAELWADTLQKWLTTNCQLVKTTLKVGPSDTGAVYVSSHTGAGVEGGEAAPPNVAVLLGKQTSTGGRAGRGRMYLPSLREDRIDSGGNIGAASMTGFNTASQALLDGLVALDAPMVLLHQSGGSSDDTPHTVTHLVPRGRVATQRRRLRR